MSLLKKCTTPITPEIVEEYKSAHPFCSVLEMEALGTGVEIINMIIKPFIYGEKFVQLIIDLERSSEIALLAIAKHDIEEEEFIVEEKKILYNAIFNHLKIGIIHPQFTLEDVVEDLEMIPSFIYNIFKAKEDLFSFKNIPMRNVISDTFPALDSEEIKKRDQLMRDKYNSLTDQFPYCLPLTYHVLDPVKPLYIIINKLGITQKTKIDGIRHKTSNDAFQQTFTDKSAAGIKYIEFLKLHFDENMHLDILSIIYAYKELYHKDLPDLQYEAINAYNLLMAASFEDIIVPIYRDIIKENTLYMNPNIPTDTLPTILFDILVSAMSQPIIFTVKDIHGKDITETMLK